MQIYFHSCLCSYLPRVPILVEDTVHTYIYIHTIILIIIIAVLIYCIIIIIQNYHCAAELTLQELVVPLKQHKNIPEVPSVYLLCSSDLKISLPLTNNKQLSRKTRAHMHNEPKHSQTHVTFRGQRQAPSVSLSEREEQTSVSCKSPVFERMTRNRRAQFLSVNPVD